MERSFAKEIESLTFGDGEVFHGEGILAVTKALLQSGVSYVGGYQGAPVSHLIDVMVQAAPQMAGLGVHVEPCTNEASAAAMLGASIIEDALKGVGVKWLRTVHTYRVEKMRKTLIEAFRSRFRGLKVIVAEGECQLERQRRAKPVRVRALAAGERVVRTRFGVDEDTCTGDHSCIRLSGCPTLTVRTPGDPLKSDPWPT